MVELGQRGDLRIGITKGGSEPKAEVMQVELGDWQVRLEKHFEQLRKDRSTIASNQPIFGLEHGLNTAELKDLSGAIREHIQHGTPSRDHRLAWIVYASELGYIYAGDEYWQTFEEETPGWTTYGNRYWLRECFFWFHETFGGARPSGRWAEHFSIICWPITHAVLPQDLQRQLARILFELRHSFSAELFESPLTLGEFIAARSWNATSRFQNLAEETLLVGQIAAALLLQGEIGTQELLYPATLQRIGEDLDRERRGRDWLRSARRFAKERAHIRGLALSHSPLSSIERRPEIARAEVVALGIEPRLILRPTNSKGTSWDILIEIPNLSHLLFRFPNLRDILTLSRCVVAGSSGRPLARGRCLHGAQRVVITRWPQPDEVLLQFEQKDSQLEYLLRTECLLRPGSTWLFRIASDGLAYELRSLRVRPGERYIIISSTGPVRSDGHVQTVKLSCEGVDGALIELPSTLPKEWEEQLRALGLSQAKTIEVWPAGLAAVVWDGEGHGEWLASERPCLAIRSDHPIDALLVSMGDTPGTSLELTPITPGEEVFVELPQLPVGLHRVHVSTRQYALGESEPLGDLDVVMRIREARPWSPGISPHGPLIVQMDPSSPTLEQLWEGRVEVALHGPDGRQVKCKVSLFERDAERATVSRQLPPLGLPVTPTGWRGHFEGQFRKLKDAENAYDTARICEIEFKADELGAFNVRCEREFTPVRWSVRRDGQGYVARLLDDSGDLAQPAVSRYTFESPCGEERLDHALAYKVPSVGGLYVVRRGNFTASIIIPPEVHSLADLSCDPQVEERERSLDAVVRLLKLAVLWRHARLSGNLLSSLRQRDVLLALTCHMFLILGGENWKQAESSARESGRGVLELKRAISKRREEAGLATVLAQEYASLVTATCDERVGRLTSLAIRFLSMPSATILVDRIGSTLIRRRPERDANDSHWLCELALRLASDPASAETWAGKNLQTGIAWLLENPTLARAARFLVIVIDRHLRQNATLGQLYAGWEWI